MQGASSYTSKAIAHNFLQTADSLPLSLVFQQVPFWPLPLLAIHISDSHDKTNAAKSSGQVEWLILSFDTQACYLYTVHMHVICVLVALRVSAISYRNTQVKLAW